MVGVTPLELETKLRSSLAGKDLRFAILFGSSVMRDPDAARDIDIAVSIARPMSLMQQAALEVELERALGKPVRRGRRRGSQHPAALGGRVPWDRRGRA